MPLTGKCQVARTLSRRAKKINDRMGCQPKLKLPALRRVLFDLDLQAAAPPVPAYIEFEIAHTEASGIWNFGLLEGFR